MKKNIIRILLLTLFFTITCMINTYAAYIVDKEYEGDKNYGVKAYRNGNKDEPLEYTIKPASKQSSSIIPTFDLTIKGNGKLYASDYIYLEFVVIHPDAASAVLNRSAKSCYLTKPTGNAGKGANVKESDITATYNRDGTFHTRVKVNKIQLDSTEKVGFYLYIANSDSGIHAHIWIEDVYSVDSLAEKNVLNEQKNIESKSSLRGFKKSDALHAISDPKEAAAHQITLAQIFTYYVDGIMGICFTIELLLLMNIKPQEKINKEIFINLLSICCLFVNLKFTGLLCSGVIAAVFYIINFYCRS